MRNMQFVGTVSGEVRTIDRITRAAAKKLYETGGTVFLTSSNIVPIDTHWTSAMKITNECGRNFDAICNEFIYYNCNHEMGYYINFYKQLIHPE